jgi:hypothetical protein
MTSEASLLNIEAVNGPLGPAHRLSFLVPGSAAAVLVDFPMQNDSPMQFGIQPGGFFVRNHAGYAYDNIAISDALRRPFNAEAARDRVHAFVSSRSSAPSIERAAGKGDVSRRLKQAMIAALALISLGVAALTGADYARSTDEQAFVQHLESLRNAQAPSALAGLPDPRLGGAPTHGAGSTLDTVIARPSQPPLPQAAAAAQPAPPILSSLPAPIATAPIATGPFGAPGNAASGSLPTPGSFRQFDAPGMAASAPAAQTNVVNNQSQAAAPQVAAPSAGGAQPLLDQLPRSFDAMLQNGVGPSVAPPAKFGFGD